MAKLLDHARAMRKEPTSAERLLWQRLRARQLGARFRRQHPIAGYIVDFYCASAKLAVELDGGGHADTRKHAYDEQRSAALAATGVRVLRFWNPEVIAETDAVVDVILRCLQGADVPARSTRVDI